MSGCKRSRGITDISSRNKRMVLFDQWCFFLAVFFILTTNTATMAADMHSKSSFTLAMIGKQLDNPFFDVAFDGCQDKAAALSTTEQHVTCLHFGTLEEDAAQQAEIVRELIARDDIDGIALSVIDAEVANLVVQEARDANKAVVTFDSDAPQSSRQAYIGTDNQAFGHELGKVLDQLAPQGGSYAVIAADAANVQLRARSVSNHLQGATHPKASGFEGHVSLEATSWREVENSPRSCQDRTDIALQVMWDLVRDYPDLDAIVSVGGWPMWNATGWQEFYVAHGHRMVLICGDSLNVQLNLMNKAYANALVGQLPYQMGELAVEKLLQLLDSSRNEGAATSDTVLYGTAFLEILQVPLNLPPLSIDDNTLDDLVYMGYIYFGVACLFCLGFGLWTFLHAKHRVIVASQPYFLYMIIAGILIMSSSLIPMTFDDDQYSAQANDRACMSVPWLCFLGFTTTFAALFSKLWRVNKIFHNPNRFKRVVVNTKDVLLPYAILMAANIVVLTVWTVHSPLKYVRKNKLGTDPWNRVIATYGTCSSGEESAEGFVIALAVVNLGVLILANVQAYQARTVTTEFSESQYIAIIMASLLQALLIGIPIIFLVREDPRTYFVVLSTLIFTTSVVVLLVMFVPKIMFWRRANKNATERGIVYREGTPSSSTNGQGGLRVRVGKAAPRSFLEGHRLYVTGLHTNSSEPHHDSEGVDHQSHQSGDEDYESDCANEIERGQLSQYTDVVEDNGDANEEGYVGKASVERMEECPLGEGNTRKVDENRLSSIREVSSSSIREVSSSSLQRDENTEESGLSITPEQNTGNADNSSTVASTIAEDSATSPALQSTNTDER